MPNFLAALMAIVSTFAQNGKPATLPPHTSAEVSVRGSAVSDLAKNFDTENVTAEVDSNTGNTSRSDMSGQTPDAPKNDGRAFGLWVSTQAKLKGQAQVSSHDEQEEEESPDTTKVEAENVHSGKQMPALIPQVAIDHSSALDVSTGNLTANTSFGQSTSSSARGNSRRP